MKRLAFALLFLVLSTASTWAQAVGTHAAGNPGSRFYSQTFTASGSFVVPSGVATLFATGCGAGGGGAGGHTADPGGGGGGGSGATCVSGMPVTVVPGSTLTLTIGTAGIGGAAGSGGGVANVATTIAGLPIGTYTIQGGNGAATFGTATNGGNGGFVSAIFPAVVGDADNGPNGTAVNNRVSGGTVGLVSGGGAGGGATGPGNGGSSPLINGYRTADTTSGAGSGTKGGGGAGGQGLLGVGGSGGSNAAGTPCTVGYGGGGGGGAASFAGGNGCPGVLYLQWWN